MKRMQMWSAAYVLQQAIRCCCLNFADWHGCRVGVLVRFTSRSGYLTHGQLMRMMDWFILKSRFSFYANERMFGEKRSTSFVRGGEKTMNGSFSLLIIDEIITRF